MRLWNSLYLFLEVKIFHSCCYVCYQSSVSRGVLGHLIFASTATTSNTVNVQVGNACAVAAARISSLLQHISALSTPLSWSLITHCSNKVLEMLTWSWKCSHEQLFLNFKHEQFTTFLLQTKSFTCLHSLNLHHHRLSQTVHRRSQQQRRQLAC